MTRFHGSIPIREIRDSFLSRNSRGSGLELILVGDLGSLGAYENHMAMFAQRYNQPLDHSSLGDIVVEVASSESIRCLECFFFDVSSRKRVVSRKRIQLALKRVSYHVVLTYMTTLAPCDY